MIITTDAEGSLVDVHSRQPVVLAPEHARQWIDPDLSPQQTEQLLLQHGRAPEDFEWFAVGKAVGSVSQ